MIDLGKSKVVTAVLKLNFKLNFLQKDFSLNF